MTISTLLVGFVLFLFSSLQPVLTKDNGRREGGREIDVLCYRCKHISLRPILQMLLYLLLEICEEMEIFVFILFFQKSRDSLVLVLLSLGFS